MKLCQCGNDSFETVYDAVPCGNTLVQIEADELCTVCRASIEYAADVCMGCERELDACLCNIDETVVSPLQQAQARLTNAISAVESGDFDKARQWLDGISELVDGADLSLIDKGAMA